MKMIGYNTMAIAFLIFSGWIAYIGGEWGWTSFAAFLLSVVPTNGSAKEEKKEEEKFTDEENGLIEELKKSFKSKS